MTENEELLKLRELVKIQKEQLEYKDSIITEKDAAITEKDAAITEKDAAITEKDAVIMEKDAAITERDAVIMEKDAVIAEKECIIHEKDELIRKKDIQLENMTQALLHARRKLFGPSTETSVMEGQTTLFDDTQSLASELLKSKKELTVKSHTRTARKPGVRQEMLAGLPTEIEEYIINPEEKCAVCGSELKIVGKRLVRTEVEYIPAKIKVKQIVQQVAKCTKCGTKDSGNPKDHFQSAAVPKTVLPHSIATPSLVAQIMYQKAAMGIPLNRQESDFYRMGLILPRGIMANWIIRCCEEWLEPVYDRIHKELMKCSILHMDETRIQCNKEEGKKAGSDSWMWVIQSAACENINATFFHYSRSRSGDVPRNLLVDFSGYLTTDAYKGYENSHS